MISQETIEQLKQLLTATWDGNLIGKPNRDELVRMGLAARAHGYNFITADGIRLLLDLHEIHP